MIFIPGYYGSTLIDQKSGRQVWGDVREILFGKQTLAMPIPGMHVPGAIDLEPHELIPDKKILGGLFKEDAYDKTIALLKYSDAEEVVSVAWDWRRDPIHGVRLLDKAVKLVKIKYPDHPLVLVSHSFGSVVASYYLRYGTTDYFQAKETWEGLKLFSKVIMSATPFRGLMAMFRNMHYGIQFGLNHNMQTPLAFSTFESSYYLLPPPGLDLVCDEKEESLSLNLHDSKNWIENRWGLFHHKLKFPTDSTETRASYITLHLSRAKKLHELIDKPADAVLEKKADLLYLSGFGSKTIHKGVWLRNTSEPNVFLYYPKNFKKWKSSLNPNVVYGDGDSTVPDFSAKLPSAFLALGAHHIQQKLSHLDCLQHQNSQKIISDFLKS